MRTIPSSSILSSLWMLLATACATTAFGQYQDTGTESARGFSNNRVQANISDQGSGYGPSGPYGPYYARPANPNPTRGRNAGEQQQTFGLPDLGLGLPGDPYLLNWYRRQSPRRSSADLGVTWSEDDDRLVAREVAANGELGRAGLRAGDELVRVDGQRVRRESDWQRVIDSIGPGREIVILLQRDGTAKMLRWTPAAEKPDERPVSEDRRPARDAETRPIRFITAARFKRGSDGHAWLGIVLDQHVSGRAVLASVERGSAADEAGLRPGDAILSLSGRDIASPGELIRTIAQIAPGSSVELFIERPRAGLIAPAPPAPEQGAPEQGDAQSNDNDEPTLNTPD